MKKLSFLMNHSRRSSSDMSPSCAIPSKQCSRSSPGADSIKIDVGSSAWAAHGGGGGGAVVEWLPAGWRSASIHRQ
jgi:hypothetical protein